MIFKNTLIQARVSLVLPKQTRIEDLRRKELKVTLLFWQEGKKFLTKSTFGFGKIITKLMAGPGPE